jgi:hypothetical protein
VILEVGMQRGPVQMANRESRLREDQLRQQTEKADCERTGEEEESEPWGKHRGIMEQ